MLHLVLSTTSVSPSVPCAVRVILWRRTNYFCPQIVCSWMERVIGRTCQTKVLLFILALSQLVRLYIVWAIGCSQFHIVSRIPICILFNLTFGEWWADTHISDQNSVFFFLRRLPSKDHLGLHLLAPGTLPQVNVRSTDSFIYFHFVFAEKWINAREHKLKTKRVRIVLHRIYLPFNFDVNWTNQSILFSVSSF